MPETEVNDVRIAAVKALERIGYEPHNDRERVAFYVAKGDTDALVTMGDPAFELLMKTALDEPAESCEWAIAALCRIPGSKALARLQELLAPRHTPRIRQEILLQLLQSGREDIDAGGGTS